MWITVRNLQIVDSRSEPYFVWKPSTGLEPPAPPSVGLDNLAPEDPPANGVSFSAQLLGAQRGTCTVRVEIFDSADNRTPVLVREFTSVPRPGTWSWMWDGRLDDGTVAPRGIYTYRLSVHAGWVPWADGDSTISSYLSLEQAYNEHNEPILEAEYWGYDDGGTPDTDTDDQHLYFIRWYVLRSSRPASSGQVWLFDPELQRIGSWDLSGLPCVEHGEQPDGLSASAAGVRHGVIVRVPVSLMVTPGEYRFVVYVVDDHADLDKCHRRRPALPLNAVTYQLAVTEVGFYLSSTYDDNQKLKWDGADPTDPGACEFAILRQQPGGNKLYIMAHVEAPQAPLPNSSVKVRLRTSVSDPQGITVTLRYSGKCPVRLGQYHFRRLHGQEIEMTNSPSLPDQRIHVRMTDEGIKEVTTFDHARTSSSNYADSQAIETNLVSGGGYVKRGRAVYHRHMWNLSTLTLPTMLRFVQAAGVERMTICAVDNRTIFHELPVKNQADILYYSGHGHSATGELECWDSGGRFTVSEVNPAANWREDLDYFIIAGCGVLHPDGINGFAWKQVALDQAGLRGLAGYYVFYYGGFRSFSGPTDASGQPVAIANRFTTYLNSGLHNHPWVFLSDEVLNAWLCANISDTARLFPAIVYTRGGYYRVNLRYNEIEGFALGEPYVLENVPPPPFGP